MSTIWSSGERVGKASLSGPAFRASGDRPRSVIRRCGAARPSLPRRFLNAIDFGFVGFVVGSVATFAVLLHVAIGRAG